MSIPGNLLSPTTETIDPNTSGWRPRANCTLSQGIGGRVGGDGCLSMHATAAGEMQIETVSTYEVTPGQEYFVFADAASGDQPERIGIEWLDYTLRPVGEITWALTTESADSSWHRISVAGVCPLGATRVRVVVSAVAAAADAGEFVENVYLGLPKRRSGNFLSFNAESGGELDLSAYAADTNCTLSRVVPPFDWTPSWYYSGGHVVQATATAAGDMAVECVERAQVTPGTDYMAQVYINPPAVVATCWVGLRFYDAAGTQLQATRAYLDPSGTGVYRQVCSDIAPSGAATAGLFVGMDDAGAGQVLRTEGAYIALAVQVPSGSVIPYADASFEQGPGAWSVLSGPGTIARSSPWGAVKTDGFYALVLTSATVGTTVLVSGRYPVTPGENWRSRIAMGPDSDGWQIDGAIRWYDADGVEIGLDGNSGLVSLPNTATWWVLTYDHEPPANAVTARCEWTFAAQQADSVMNLDAAMLRAVLPQTDVEANEETASVTVTMRELDIGELATIWRVGPDGGRTLVRGADGLIERTPITSDLWVIEDYEAPIGVPVSYYAEFTFTDGSAAGFYDTGRVMLEPGDPNYVWLKDPGNPQRNMQLMVRQGPDWTRPIGQSEHRVRGRRNSVVFSDVRGGLEGELVIATTTDEQRRLLHWLLDTGNTLLWQAVPGMGVDDMYVNIGEVPEARDGGPADDPWREWKLPMRQADMPTAVGVNGSAGRTWQDVLLEFATWGDVLDAFGTWEDVFLNRRKEA